MHFSSLTNRLSRWQWAGLASVFIVAFITAFQYPVSPQVRDPAPISNDGSESAGEHASPAAPHIVSKFHLLAPASGFHFRLCRLLASAMALGYPVPTLNGWMKEGELDAAKTHLAKVRTVMHYLNDLPPSSDDDLVLMIDGYDVVFQIPADVLIERYFDVINKANDRLAMRFKGKFEKEEDMPRLSILFGSEKACYPPEQNRIGCWAIPQKLDIPMGAYGPVDGNYAHNVPIWLNSGTIMGPVKDMRLMFAATLDLIAKRYSREGDWSDSDQLYMSEVWGMQEYSRTIAEYQEYFHGDIDINTIWPTDYEKVLPDIAPGQRTEYHIGIDHWSSLFQTRAGSDHVLDMLTFDQFHDQENATSYAIVHKNTANLPNFKPFTIDLPANLASSITRILRMIEPVVGTVPSITQIRLETNLVSKEVYGMFHSTGGKDYLDKLWDQSWFYPYVRPLIEAMLPRVSEQPIGTADGRTWVSSHKLAVNSTEAHSVADAGAWADIDGGWLTWDHLCGKFEKEVFEGYTPPMDD
ncbi:hypothetical protein N7539_009378 [Penicillium diatomitis]|uniref:Uncharacterized protein n=1 Tax=Penicillium diatomitis TaxID=2819901 RepID=A0A9W9WKC9_9EURO|nr:uncharacterized protein N7539_009378 [Penicillium diatomitis]KAJ5466649.1 hypothetical protein N7539_009378 [Penicillium diatomitis]